jgi:hypothetical protein
MFSIPTLRRDILPVTQLARMAKFPRHRGQAGSTYGWDRDDAERW